MFNYANIVHIDVGIWMQCSRLLDFASEKLMLYICSIYSRQMCSEQNNVEVYQKSRKSVQTFER